MSSLLYWPGSETLAVAVLNQPGARRGRPDRGAVGPADRCCCWCRRCRCSCHATAAGSAARRAVAEPRSTGGRRCRLIDASDVDGRAALRRPDGRLRRRPGARSTSTSPSRPGEVVALLGASGSGKSTLLHAVAGLPAAARPARSGWPAGAVATSRQHAPPEQRDVGLVFQNYALWPHLSVLDTVAYPLRRAGGVPRRRPRAGAATCSTSLDIAHLAERRPAELSGGEQQRVGLARALARDARAVPARRADRAPRHPPARGVPGLEIARTASARPAPPRSTRPTTPPRRSASPTASRSSGDGRLVQIGSPADVYAQPVSLWAAAAHRPGSRADRASHAAAATSIGLRVGDGRRPACRRRRHADRAVGAPRQVLLRPDWASAGGPLSGRLDAVAFRGPHTDYVIDDRRGSRAACDAPVRRGTRSGDRSAGRSTARGCSRPAEPVSRR